MLEKSKVLAISFSGGRSSAVMTKLLWDKYGNDPNWIVHVLFANTGCEDERTLEFVNQCQEYFGWPLVWLEAVIDQRKGVGVRHRSVSFDTASRKGEPFEAAVRKYGLFNVTYSACTARLKTEVMESYLRTFGLKFRKGFGVDHYTAIGIRADEMDRVSSKRHERKLIYPLIDLGVRKRDVALEIQNWGFDLKIPNDAYGNCVWCWKKSHRKHLTLAKESPQVFDFPLKMEALYSSTKSPEKPRRWFRENRSVLDILEESKVLTFDLYRDDQYDHATDLDVGGACGESCEVGNDA